MVMAGSTSDCYLCGATNDADASYCVRCNGQLLKLPAFDLDDEDPSAAEASNSDPIAEAPDPEEQQARTRSSRLSQLRRKSSLDHQRLSDALGLGGQEEQDAPVTTDMPETKVTAVPVSYTHLTLPTNREV